MVTQDIPRINWSSVTNTGPFREYKFVQLYVDGEPYFRIQDDVREEVYHGQILENFLKEMGIDYEIAMRPDHCDCPACEGEGYEAVGMGVTSVDLKRKKVEILSWKLSTDYSIGVNEDHLRKLQQLEPDFSFEID